MDSKARTTSESLLTTVEAFAAFAKDTAARLEWFYRRTPYADARHGIYPVARER